MRQEYYSFSAIDKTRYYFNSEGKRTIIKIVEFTSTSNKQVVNLAFGDLLPEGKFDDLAISDNGDMRKILATVIQIVAYFSLEFPDTTIMFAGSSGERTLLYERILRMHYTEFSANFVIIGVIEKEERLIQLVYTPAKKHRKYVLFFVKRKA